MLDKGSFISRYQPVSGPIKNPGFCLMTPVAFDVVMSFVNTVRERVAVLSPTVTHRAGFGWSRDRRSLSYWSLIVSFMAVVTPLQLGGDVSLVNLFRIPAP